MENHYSYLSQKLANYYPSWARGRQDRQSVLQYFANPIANELQEVLRRTRIALNNGTLSTTDMYDIDIVYETKLGLNFDFQYDTSDYQIPKLIFPTVTVEIDTVPTAIDNAEGNTLDNFWYNAAPTRLTIDATSLPYSQVLLESSLVTGSFDTFNDPYEPGYLYVTISDATVFINESTREEGYVRISGINRQGLQDYENVSFLFNMTKRTVKEWKSISTVEVININLGSDPKIKIDALDFNHSHYSYSDELYYDELGPKDLFIRPATIGGEAHLEYLIYNISQQEDLYAGDLYLHEQVNNTIKLTTIDTVRLLSSSEGTIGALLDVALQDNRYKAYVLSDDGKLRIYNTRNNYIDSNVLRERTPDVKTAIDIDSDMVTNGDTVKLKPHRHTGTNKIIKYKWDIEKPNGTKSTFKFNATTGVFDEIAYATNADSSAWSINPYEHTSPYDFSYKTLEYAIDSYGGHIVTLNTMYDDGNIDIDIRALQSKSIVPIAEITCGVANPVGISINSDGEICIIDNVDDVHKIDLYYDYTMIDIENKIVYTREEYDDIQVTY